MKILTFHLQLQFKYELFHIYVTSIVTSVCMHQINFRWVLNRLRIVTKRPYLNNFVSNRQDTKDGGTAELHLLVFISDQQSVYMANAK